jgi:hypothetical protein
MNAIRPLLFWSALLTFLAFNNFISAQAEEIRIKSDGSIIDKDTEKKLDGVQVIIFKNGAQERVFDAGTSGKFDFTLPLGYSYDLKFSRADYVTKIIRIDTRNIPEEDRRGGFLMEFESSLFKYVDGFNTDILKEPMGKAAFDSQTNYVTFDFAYTDEMNKKIEAEFKRLADLAKNGDKQKKEFEKLIQEGDAKMTGTKYQEAMDKYKSALAIFPSDKPAQDKYDEAERKYNEFLASKNNDAQYNQLIKEADALFKNKDWENAKDKYNDAVAMRNSENYPKNQIIEIDKKLLELENERKFKEIVARADQEFNSENFETCINSYKDALQIKSNDTYVKKQIDAANAALLAIANDKSKQDEIEKRYKALIAAADDLFSKKQYLECIAKYKGASEIKPSEDYPTEQIDKANKALNASKTVVNTPPPAEDKNLAEYNRLISEADKLLQESNLNIESKLKDSRAKYLSAQTLKETERYPSRQIATIDQALANLSSTSTTTGENWREKRLRQERELEEVRRLKEKELEEARAARLAEQKAAEEKEEELRLKELQKQKIEKREIDLSAEAKVEEFYRDAQKKADRRKILDIQNEKSRDSLNQALNLAKEKESIRKATQEIEVSQKALAEISINNEKLQQKNQAQILTEIEYAKTQDEKNIIIQNQLTEREIARIEKEKEYDALSRQKNTEFEDKQQMNVARDKELFNEISLQIAEREKEYLAKSTAQIKNEQDYFNKNNEENQKTEEANRKLEQIRIENEKKYEEISKSKELELIEKNRMKLNSEIHYAKMQEISNIESEEKALDRARKQIEIEAKQLEKPVITEEITERSYETSQPSRNIIETTIKRGAKITVYRKVVSKFETLYYENDICISMDEWLIETKRK